MILSLALRLTGMSRLAPVRFKRQKEPASTARAQGFKRRWPALSLIQNDGLKTQTQRQAERLSLRHAQGRIRR